MSAGPYLLGILHDCLGPACVDPSTHARGLHGLAVGLGSDPRLAPGSDLGSDLGAVLGADLGSDLGTACSNFSRTKPCVASYGWGAVLVSLFSALGIVVLGVLTFKWMGLGRKAGSPPSSTGSPTGSQTISQHG